MRVRGVLRFRMRPIYFVSQKTKEFYTGVRNYHQKSENWAGRDV